MSVTAVTANTTQVVDDCRSVSRMETAVEHREGNSAQPIEPLRSYTNNLIIGALAFATLVLHLLTNLYLMANPHYGFHGDELYFIACGDHLAWGYVDLPPLVPFFARVSRLLMGDSLVSIRFFPGLAHAGLVFLTGLTARALGGDRFAQVLASLSVLFAPVFLLPGNFLTTALEPMWTVCAFLLILILRDHRSKLWLVFGIAAGLGFLNKHSMAFWGVGLVVGLLFAARDEFRSRWTWLGAGVALLIVLPNLAWEQHHHWVTLTALRQARDFNRLPFSFSNFWLTQVMLNGLAALPIWLAGLLFFLIAKEGRRYLAIGIAFVAVVAFLTLENGKSYYLSPAIPVILAGGTVQIAAWSAKFRARWLRPALLAAFATWGFIWMPMALPLLSPATLVRYQNLLRYHGSKFEKSDIGAEIPTYFGNMIGWPEVVQAVAQAYGKIPPAQRSQTAILANNYAQAGAVDLLGEKYGLPKAISGHENYWYWGPRGYTGARIIGIGFSPEEARRNCAIVEVAATVDVPYAPDWTNGPVIICSDLRPTLPELWRDLQRFH